MRFVGCPFPLLFPALLVTVDEIMTFPSFLLMEIPSPDSSISGCTAVFALPNASLATPLTLLMVSVFVFALPSASLAVLVTMVTLPVNVVMLPSFAVTRGVKSLILPSCVAIFP